MKRLLTALLMAAALLTTSGCVTVMNIEKKAPFGFFFTGGGMIRVNHEPGQAWFLTPDGWKSVEELQRQPQNPGGIEIR